MSQSWVVGGVCGVGVWLGASVAFAQCTKDVDCKGDRVCEAGSCVAPGSPLPPPPPAPAGAEGASAPPPPGEAGGATAPPAAGGSGTPTSAAVPLAAAPAAAAPAAAPPAASASTDATLMAPNSEVAPAYRRRSKGLLAGGIVMTSFGGLSLLVALVRASEQSVCESRWYGDSDLYREDCSDYDASIYGFTIGGVSLISGGIAMIVIGGKKVRVTEAATLSVAPWAKPDGAGLGFRLDM